MIAHPIQRWFLSEALRSSVWRLGLHAVSLLLPLLIWQVVSHAQVVDPAFLPSPGQVIDSLWSMARSGILMADASASIRRVMLGFLLAAVVGTPLGILMGSFATIRALLEPLSGFLRYMPAAAFTPLLIIYLGIDEAPKIALIAIGTVFFNMLMVMDSVKFVPRELIETTLTLGGSRRQVVAQVITRYTLPSIIDTLRINMATSWNLLVVAELLAAEVGLGKRIQLAQRFFRTDQIFADLLVLGLTGFAIDLAFQGLLRLTCRWAV
ncbi:MAG: ABC transporter permease [Cyanobacteria bacterium MAG CAR1_bin_15]|nr:ABC transporter permease [Cyanobacteria bacterium MAG CAR1_bin_15]